MRRRNSLFDENLARQQQIKMFGHGAGQRILDRDDGGSDRAALHPIKNLGRARARDNLAARNHAMGGFLAERTSFSLYRNLDLSAASPGSLHCGKLAGSGGESKSFFSTARQRRRNSSGEWS